MKMETEIILEPGTILTGAWQNNSPLVPLPFVVAQKEIWRNSPDGPFSIMARVCYSELNPNWETSTSLPTIRDRRLQEGRDYEVKAIGGYSLSGSAFAQELYVGNFQHKGLVVFLNKIPLTALAVDEMPDHRYPETILTFYEVPNMAIEITKFKGRTAHAAFVQVLGD